MNNSNNQIIEEFKGVKGSGKSVERGSNNFNSSRGSSSHSPLSINQYKSARYASVSPITGSMSGLANVQPNSTSGLGIIKPGSKTGSGTFTGGSFGGDGKYVVGFPGIKHGSTLPASSSPSLYMKPKITPPHPNISVKPLLIPDVTKPYGKIDKYITHGIPGPKIGNKYDNVNHNHNYKNKNAGPTFPSGFNWRDKNLTGYYGYQGWGYGFDPWYWGYGPFYPYDGTYVDYPDIPYNYEDLMQKEIDADNMVNTIQNQIATQLMEQEIEAGNINDEIIDNTDNKKEGFETTTTCNKNNILVILAIVLIFYILFSVPINKTGK